MRRRSQFAQVSLRSNGVRLTFGHTLPLGSFPSDEESSRLVAMQLSTQKPDILALTVTLFGLGTLLTAVVQAFIG